MQEEELQELYGKITAVVYTNEENGWTVLRLESSEDGGTATVVGTLPAASGGSALSSPAAKESAFMIARVTKPCTSWLSRKRTSDFWGWTLTSTRCGLIESISAYMGCAWPCSTSL